MSYRCMTLWSSTNTTGDEALVYGVKYYHTAVSSVGLCKKLTLWLNFHSLMVVWETRSAHKIHFKLHWSTLYSSCCLTFSFNPLLAVVFKHFRNNTFPIPSRRRCCWCCCCYRHIHGGRTGLWHGSSVSHWELQIPFLLLSAGKTAVWGNYQLPVCQSDCCL